MSVANFIQTDTGLVHEWVTQIAFAGLNPQNLLEPLPDWPEGVATSQQLPIESIGQRDGIRSAFAEAAIALGSQTNEGCSISRIELRVERWRSGYEAPAITSDADYLGWLVVRGRVAEHSDAGTIALLDPRAGSNMVAVPGIPWGRPLVIAPRSGNLVVHPSWIVCSVLPLDPGQEAVVVRAEIDLSAPRSQPS